MKLYPREERIVRVKRKFRKQGKKIRKFDIHNDGNINMTRRWFKKKTFLCVLKNYKILKKP